MSLMLHFIKGSKWAGVWERKDSQPRVFISWFPGLFRWLHAHVSRLPPHTKFGKQIPWVLHCVEGVYSCGGWLAWGRAMTGLQRSTFPPPRIVQCHNGLIIIERVGIHDHWQVANPIGQKSKRAKIPTYLSVNSSSVWHWLAAGWPIAANAVMARYISTDCLTGSTSTREGDKPVGMLATAILLSKSINMTKSCPEIIQSNVEFLKMKQDLRSCFVLCCSDQNA